jgi:hypothetical protein
VNRYRLTLKVGCSVLALGGSSILTSTSPLSATETPPSTFGEGSSFCAQSGASQVPGGYALGASYLDDYACGPANNAGAGYEVPAAGPYMGFFEDSNYEYQCTELADRFLFDDYGKDPVNGTALTGANFVTTAAAASDLAEASYVPGSHTLPAAGDIVSMWSATNSVGHVAVVTSVQSSLLTTGTGYIQVIEENGATHRTMEGGFPVGGGSNVIRVVNWRMSYNPPGGPDYYNEFKWLTHFQPGSIARDTDGRSWVINQASANSIPNGGTYLCAQYREKLPIVAAGNRQASTDLPIGPAYSCTFNGTILVASNTSPAQFYWFSGGRGHLINQGTSVQFNLSLEYYLYVTNQHQYVAPLGVIRAAGGGLGGAAPLELLVSSLAENSVIQEAVAYSQGGSWVVRSGHRQPIPYIQDDICWRDKVGSPVLILAATQIADVPNASSSGKCIIGPAIVKSSDGSSYFVDSANQSHWIPDVETYNAIAYAMTSAVSSVTGIPNETIPVLGPWPSSDVGDLPVAQAEPSVLDWQDVAHSIVEGIGGSSWVVERSGDRRWIPYTQDWVCWKDKAGIPLGRSNLLPSQLNSLVEGPTDPCVIGPAVVTASDGASYQVDSANQRHWIPDIPTYFWYTDQYGGHYGPWPASDVNLIPSGNGTGDPMMGKIIDSPRGNAYFVGTNSDLYWISGGVGGTIFNCLEGRGVVYFGPVQANVVDNFNDSNHYQASCS